MTETEITLFNKILEWVADNPDTVISASAFFVSLCVLGLTISQVIQTAKHNKLSVRSYLTTSMHPNDDGKFLVILENCGIGPAIIRDFIVLYHGEEVAKNNLEQVENFVLETFPNVDGKYYSMVPNSAMQAGEKKALLEIVLDANSFHLIENIEHIDIVINYESMYRNNDDVFNYDSRIDRGYHRLG